MHVDLKLSSLFITDILTLKAKSLIGRAIISTMSGKAKLPTLENAPAAASSGGASSSADPYAVMNEKPVVDKRPSTSIEQRQLGMSVPLGMSSKFDNIPGPMSARSATAEPSSRGLPSIWSGPQSARESVSRGASRGGEGADTLQPLPPSQPPSKGWGSVKDRVELASNRKLKMSIKRVQQEMLGPLRLQTPRGWFPPEAVLDAADVFETDHREKKMDARAKLNVLRTDPMGRMKQRDFEQSLSAVRDMRYVVQPLRFGVGRKTISSTVHSINNYEVELMGEKSGPWFEMDDKLLADDKPRARRKRWRLDKSVWGPRRTTSNSLDFYETMEAIRPMFEMDWRMARATHGLESFIGKVQKEAVGVKEISAERISQEIEEVNDGWREMNE